MFKCIIQLSLLALMATAMSVNRYRQPVEEDQMMQMLRAECNKYGSPDSYSKLMEGHFTFKLKLAQMVTELKMENQDKDVPTTVKSICRKLPEFREAYTKMFKSTEPCTNPAKGDSVQRTIRAADEITDFLCEKEGQSVVSFLEEGGPVCVENAKQEILSCALPTITKYSAKITPDVQDEEKCRDVSTLKHCVLDNMETCPKPGPARFMNSIFNIIVNHVPCNATSTNEIN